MHVYVCTHIIYVYTVVCVYVMFVEMFNIRTYIHHIRIYRGLRICDIFSSIWYVLNNLLLVVNRLIHLFTI